MRRGIDEIVIQVILLGIAYQPLKLLIIKYIYIYTYIYIYIYIYIYTYYMMSTSPLPRNESRLMSDIFPGRGSVPLLLLLSPASLQDKDNLLSTLEGSWSLMPVNTSKKVLTKSMQSNY
jgi:hypothetical protein